MTMKFQNGDAAEKAAYNSVLKRRASPLRSSGVDNWDQTIRQLRGSLGLTQQEFAEWMGVKQASVSRWENGRDIPGIAIRKRLVDLRRQDSMQMLKQQILARLTYGTAPISVVGNGAQFLGFSASFRDEVGIDVNQLRGMPIYGRFGEMVDSTTAVWERCGLFSGDIAFTLTVLEVQDAEGETFYLKNFDTPHVIDKEIISVCEIKRISQSEYDKHLKTYGSPVFSMSFDELGGQR